MIDENRLNQTRDELRRLTDKLERLETAPLPLREARDKLDTVLQIAAARCDDRPLIAALFDPDAPPEQIVEQHAQTLLGNPKMTELMTPANLYASREDLRRALTDAVERHARTTDPGPPWAERIQAVQQLSERIEELRLVERGLTAAADS